MKVLAQKLIEQKRLKAVEMLGKKIEVEMRGKAISIDEEKKTAIFVMSTSNIDRHGDIIDQDSWILKYFEANPMFFLQHRSDEFPIGKWLRIWLEVDPDNADKKRLVGEAEFRVEYADAARAFDHVVKGDMGAVSVGFIPHRVDYDEEKDAFVLFDCELMECSLVGIGSNRQALLKGNTIEDVKEIVIEARNSLDNVLKNNENKNVKNNLIALRLIAKAVRQIK